MNSFKSQRCIEIKTFLSGAVQQYSCERLYFENTFGILRYVVDKVYRIDAIRLMPGDVTTALYWTDRPYTLYIWHVKGNEDGAYYFNIADSITLLPGEFRWRDLIVDILIDSEGTIHVLDEDELPADLPAELEYSIMAAKAHVLAHYGDIIMEANSLVNKYVSHCR